MLSGKKSDKGHKVAEEEAGDDCWSKQANGSLLCQNFDSLLKVQRVLFGLIYDFFPTRWSDSQSAALLHLFKKPDWQWPQYEK